VSVFVLYLKANHSTTFVIGVTPVTERNISLLLGINIGYGLFTICFEDFNFNTAKVFVLI
jgi:hypothetical protein